MHTCGSIGSGGGAESAVNSLDLDGFDVLRFRSQFLQVESIMLGSRPSIKIFAVVIFSLFNADCGGTKDEKGKYNNYFRHIILSYPV